MLVMLEPTLLFSIGEFVADINLVLKIFVLLTIISFVKNHLGKGFISIVIILAVSWFVLFDYWKFFGGIYLIYMMLMFGVSGVLVDFFFVGGMGRGKEVPDVSGKEVHARRAQMGLAQKALMRFRRPPGR